VVSLVNGISVVAKREGRMLLTEKTLFIAILVQLFVASFSAFLSLGFAVMFSPSAIGPELAEELKIGVVGDVEGISGSLIALMSDHIGVIRFATLQDAQAALRTSEVDGVMNIKKRQDESLEPIQLELFLPKNNFKSSLVTVQIKRALEQFQDKLRMEKGIEVMKLNSPVDVEDVSKFFEFKYAVLVPMLILLPAFLSSGMIIDMITEEYELGTLELLRVSPLKFSEVIYGKMLVMVLIAPIQATLWILLMKLNHIAIYNQLEILLFLTLVTLILVQAGAILSIYFKQRSSVHLVFSAAFALLVLLSGLLPVPPMNIVALQAAGSGVGAGNYIWYIVAAFILHLTIKILPEMSE